MTAQPTKRAASEPLPRPLDPTVLPDRIEVRDRVMWVLCGSGQEAEDDGYMLRALGAAHVSRPRESSRG